MATVTGTGVFRRVTSWHPPLMLFAGLMTISAVVALGGIVLDDRVLTGEPIWLKPFKFSVSLAVYAVTWAWLLSLQRRRRRWVERSSTVIVFLGGLEMVIIIAQVLRGERSHFNASSVVDTALFSIMGGTIAALWLISLIQAAVLLRDQLAERSLALAIRFGVLVGLAGMALAFLMTGPTPEQGEALRQGAEIDAIGAHSVGVSDGGDGMPVTGWSTTGGDLRVPHFVGLHAMQALPVVALALRAAGRRFVPLRAETVRARLMWVAGSGYAGLVALVTWQALRGEPLIAPGAGTLWAAAALLGGVLLGGWLAVARDRGDVVGVDARAPELSAHEEHDTARGVRS